MRHKPLIASLLALLTMNLTLSNAVPTFGASDPVTIWVKRFSVNTLALDIAKNNRNVKMVAILKSSSPLKSEDLKCEGIETPKEQTFSLVTLDDGLYRASCSLTYGVLDTKGRSEVALGINDDESRLGWQMVPFNAKSSIPESYEDSFGIKRTKETLVFSLESNRTFFAAPVAVSPPSDYKLPSFNMGEDGYIIFDSPDGAPAKPIVTFSKNKKTFDLSCPLPTSNVSSQAKYQTLTSFWINKKRYKPQNYLGWWFPPNFYKNSAIDKSLRGKAVKIACATKYVLPESNVLLAYTESKEITVKIPK
ncbi:MAG: hypothetical protein RIT08_572 [Actinomycetota bacterium]